jgi:hypothetical protein
MCVINSKATRDDESDTILTGPVITVSFAMTAPFIVVVVVGAANEKAEWLRGCSRNPTQADGWAFFVFCRRIKKRGNKP